ncbi:hypothetical protein [Actinoplanes sp. NBRC 101535]|uniref:hypothetical protein n=1 Tax=Actinoplanes sp. NBRC 101535 TaxID=3032196 RepID=UPI0024A5B926|nr:hypothetical protein [Actinoplanes sp. NBRC 101535]GLY08318.1 hypothetical protein Acsp01_86970 [Actinoplanes sp. NBRC 101535]
MTTIEPAGRRFTDMTLEALLPVLAEKASVVDDIADDTAAGRALYDLMKDDLRVNELDKTIGALALLLIRAHREQAPPGERAPAGAGQDEPRKPVAVWYVNNFDNTTYDIFGSEPEAALNAAGLERDGVVLGVQFADGRAVPAGEWPALEDGRRRLREFEAARAAARQVPAEQRVVRDPFRGVQVHVDADEPGWLGGQEPVAG